MAPVVRPPSATDAADFSSSLLRSSCSVSAGRNRNAACHIKRPSALPETTMPLSKVINMKLRSSTSLHLRTQNDGLQIRVGAQVCGAPNLADS